MSKVLTESTKNVPSDRRAAPSDIGQQLRSILGYDVFEVAAPEDVYDRAARRLQARGDTVPAEDVLGDLTEE